MRLLLVLAAAALATAVTAAPQKPGVERWAVKLMAPVGDPQVRPLIGLIAMPDASGVTHNDPRFQSVRFVGEGTPVATTGYLRLVARETDGDFHMQLTPDPTGNGPCLIVETPDPQYVTDPVLKAQVGSVRSWVLAHALNGRNPSSGGTMLKQPVRVTVTGALFYDDAHVNTPPRGKRGMKAVTLWELHPVTAIASAP